MLAIKVVVQGPQRSYTELIDRRSCHDIHEPLADVVKRCLRRPHTRERRRECSHLEFPAPSITVAFALPVP